MERLIFLLSQNYEMLTPIVVFVSFFASRQAYRLIHFIGISKKLFSKPNSRSSHFVPVPQFGGVGLYFATCMTASVFVALLVFHNFGGLADKVYEPGGVLAFISGLTLIFYTGFVDDLIDMKASLKFLFQVVSVAIIMLPTNGFIDHFFGIFGVEELSNAYAIPFTFFVYLLVINAFNLIDGIDGLAASLGIIGSLFFGVYFASVDRYDLVILNFSLLGALGGFLISNFSKTKKLFLGDSGSMVVGICMAFQAVQFLIISPVFDESSVIGHAPVYVLSILAYPLIDVMRVIISRLLRNKSPFLPDRNHIHHKLLDLGFSHMKATGIIVAYTFVLVLLTYLTSDLNIHFHLIVMTITAVSLALVPVNIHKIRSKSKIAVKTIKKQPSVLKAS